MSPLLESIGWVATAAFASSYFSKDAAVLRRIQALAASLWVVYGLMIHARPVVAANLIVAGLAVASSLRRPRGSNTNNQVGPTSVGAGL